MRSNTHTRGDDDDDEYVYGDGDDDDDDGDGDDDDDDEYVYGSGVNSTMAVLRVLSWPTMELIRTAQGTVPGFKSSRPWRKLGCGTSAPLA